MEQTPSTHTDARRSDIRRRREIVTGRRSLHVSKGPGVGIVQETLLRYREGDEQSGVVEPKTERAPQMTDEIGKTAVASEAAVAAQVPGKPEASQ